MRSINYVIVELTDAYENEVELSDNKSVIVNSTIENVEYVNRIAKVITAPKFTILKEGDSVIVHHNIFRLRNGIKGERLESNFFIEDNKYFVPLTEVFMYKRNGEWEAIDPYCFIKPISKEKKEGFDLSINEDTYKGRIHQHGTVKYPNTELREQGVKEGDRVFFSKNSEYEFNIDGELYYKMSTKDVLLVK